MDSFDCDLHRLSEAQNKYVKLYIYPNPYSLILFLYFLYQLRGLFFVMFPIISGKFGKPLSLAKIIKKLYWILSYQIITYYKAHSGMIFYAVMQQFQHSIR